MSFASKQVLTHNSGQLNFSICQVFRAKICVLLCWTITKMKTWIIIAACVS